MQGIVRVHACSFLSWEDSHRLTERRKAESLRTTAQEDPSSSVIGHLSDLTLDGARA